MKFWTRPVGLKVLRELEEKGRAFREKEGIPVEGFIIVSNSGFDEELVKEARRREVILIDLLRELSLTAE